MLQVNFKSYGSYVTDSLYQWDRNQTLNITGISLKEAPEIHFTNVNMDRAIVRESIINKGVITSTIPNSLLQEPFAITAYVGVYEDETFKVIETIKIPVIAKPRPTDYVFEDDAGEVYSYNELLNKMKKFDGVDFDVVRNYEDWVNRVKDTYTKDETLTDSTKNLLGLGVSAVPNDVLNILATNNHRMIIGSYKGAGTHGQNNPNKITFDFTPKVLFLLYDGVIFARGSSSAYIRSYNTSGDVRIHKLNVTWTDNSIEWYLPSTEDIVAPDTDSHRLTVQANEAAQTYYYIVLG